MPRKKFIEKKLQDADAEVGDRIKISSNKDIKEGVLMPHHDFSDEDIVNIKLDNGYNIGLAIDKGTEIELVKKHKKVMKKPKEIPFDKSKPTISMIGTGGTIACYVDYRTGAVHPASSAKELAFAIPGIFDISNVKTEVAFQILSENIEVRHWKALANKIADELNSGVKGVVIPHGTDTLGYTAAALSFMLKNLTGPVVLVGSQRSSDRPSSDATVNLTNAVKIAAKSDIGEIVAAMHGSISDKVTYIHRGTKVRKFHTSRRDAFKTVNERHLGEIKNDSINFNEKYNKISKGPVTVDDKMSDDVSLVYYHPNLKPEDIPDKKGIVLAGTGLGHVSTKVIPRIKSMIEENGSVFLMTSQCFFGRVNMNVYSTGRDLIKAGVIPCEDMLPETAYVKLMWALGHTKNKEKIETLIGENIAGEISNRSRSDVFL